MPTIPDVNQDWRLGRVPVVNIMGSELVMPLQFSGVGVQRQDAICEEVVARPITIIGIRKRIACGPVQSIGLRIIRAGQPGWAASELGFFAFPGFNPWFPFSWYCPETPHAFASVDLICGKKSANAPVTPRNARDYHVLDDQRRYSRAILLSLIGHHRFPHHLACRTVQGDQVGVVGRHEHLVAKDGHAPIGTQGCIAYQSSSARARIFPDHASRQGVQR